MKDQDKKLLKSLGYDVRKKNVKVLNDAINLVEECMGEYNPQQIKELVSNKSSFIYVELRCYYEIGLNQLATELSIAHEKRNFNSIDIETYANVFGNNFKPTLEESIVSIANYKAKQAQKQNENVKIKRPNEVAVKLVTQAAV